MAGSADSGAAARNPGIVSFAWEQQAVFGPDVSCKPSSAMFIRSQSDWLGGVAHSAGFPVISAQAESGTVPIPARLKAKPRISSRRILA